MTPVTLVAAKLNLGWLHNAVTRGYAGFNHTSYMTATILIVPNWERFSYLAVPATYRS